MRELNRLEPASRRAFPQLSAKVLGRKQHRKRTRTEIDQRGLVRTRPVKRLRYAADGRSGQVIDRDPARGRDGGRDLRPVRQHDDPPFGVGGRAAQVRERVHRLGEQADVHEDVRGLAAAVGMREFGVHVPSMTERAADPCGALQTALRSAKRSKGRCGAEGLRGLQ